MGSAFFSCMVFKQVSLSKEVYKEQRMLVDSQEVVSTGPAYQNTWRQLAVHIYYAGKQDPDLAAVLKNEKVTISTTAPPGPTSPTPSSSKVPSSTPPLHPAAQ